MSEQTNLHFKHIFSSLLFQSLVKLIWISFTKPVFLEYLWQKKKRHVINNLYFPKNTEKLQSSSSSKRNNGYSLQNYLKSERTQSSSLLLQCGTEPQCSFRTKMLAHLRNKLINTLVFPFNLWAKKPLLNWHTTLQTPRLFRRASSQVPHVLPNSPNSVPAGTARPRPN